MASGKLVRGDLGSETVLRFSVIGKPSLLVGVVERVASIKGVPMLSEGGLYRAVKHTAEIRVHLQTVLHDDTEHVLYELIRREVVEEAEWMYQLEQAGCGKWDAFNIAATTMLKGKTMPDLSSIVIQSELVEQLYEFSKTGHPEPLAITKR